MISLEIYKASAGSGKTTLLTEKTLALILQNPLKYKEILAVTFTNKATDEMKTRILESLIELTHAHESDVEKWNKILDSSFTVATLSERAKACYAQILHHYGRFQVSTIDAFVQKIIRSFAWEMGLSGNYRLELNTEAVKNDLAEMLFKQIEHNEVIKKMIIDLVLDRINQGNKWDFRKELLSLADEMFKEQFYLFEQTLAQSDDYLNDLDEFFNTLRNIVSQYEDSFKNAAKAALDIIHQHGFSQDQLSNGKSGFYGGLLRISKGSTEISTRLHEAIHDAKKWVTTANFKTNETKVLACYQAVLPFFNVLINLHENHSKRYYDAAILFSNFSLIRLVAELAQLLKQYRSENEVLLISDSNKLLNILVEQNDTPFIYERTGSSLHHFLLDEFQDTSTIQWKNFKPLMADAMSNQNYNLIVGDSKQAIYRWRSGDWRLLQYGLKNQLHQELLQEKNLDTNYRSDANIVAFNNLLFKKLSRQISDQFKNESIALSEVFIDAYKEVEQLIPTSKSNSGGIIQISLLDTSNTKKNYSDEDNFDKNQHSFNYIFKTIQTLLSKQVEPGQIAILVRKNEQAAKVVDYLLSQINHSEYKYSVVSSEALLINQSPLIQSVICLLKIYFGYQDDVVHEHLRKNLERLNEKNGIEHFVSKMKNTIDTFPHFSLLYLIEKTVHLFSIENQNNAAQYIYAFYDVVADYSKFGNKHPYDFIDWWMNEGIKKSIQASGKVNAIEVVTVHKSKGLAYPYVIIPFANWPLDSQIPNSLFWVQTKNSNFSLFPVLPIQYRDKRLEKSSFYEAKLYEKSEQYLDALNVFYVAMTRARNGIFISAEINAKRTKGIFDIIKDLIDKEKITSDFEVDQSDSLVFTKGTIKSIKDRQSTDIKDITSTKITNFEVSKLLQSFNNKSFEVFKYHTDTQATHFGTAMHFALSLLIYPENKSLALNKTSEKFNLLPYEISAIEEMLDSILQSTFTNEWFSKEALRILTERSFVYNGEVKKPDRIVLFADKTLLVDYKFTLSKLSSHEIQVKEYKMMLEELTFPDVQAVLFYPFINELITV